MTLRSLDPSQFPGVIPNDVGTVGHDGVGHDRVGQPSRQQAEDAVRLLLAYIGEDPHREGLQDTPRRFVSWLEEYSPLQPPPSITTFEDVAYDQMVVVSGISLIGLCEHHLRDFVGSAAVAYLPTRDGGVVGLSKLARIVEWAAKRPQVQERMTEQIRALVEQATGSRDVGVVVQAEHTCMSFRGIKKPGHMTTTSSLSGAFRDDAQTRAEFLNLIGR